MRTRANTQQVGTANCSKSTSEVTSESELDANGVDGFSSDGSGSDDVDDDEDEEDLVDTSFYRIPKFQHPIASFFDRDNYYNILETDLRRSKEALKVYVDGETTCCPICKKQLRRPDLHTFKRRHLIYHIRPIKCKRCDFRTHVTTMFKTHVTGKHLGQFMYNCTEVDGCLKKYSSKQGLTNHIDEAHLGKIGTRLQKPKKFKCSFCSKAFGRAKDVQLHECIHTGLKAQVCTFCPKTFIHKADLNAHIRGGHTKEKPYSCDWCDYSTSRAPSLKLHLQTHKVKAGLTPPVQCPTCHKSFSTKPNLQSHVRMMHAWKLSCVICAKGFNDPHQLAEHTTRRHSKRVCSICHKVLACWSQMRAHKQYHHDDGSNLVLKCEECQLGYKRKAIYEAHMLYEHQHSIIPQIETSPSTGQLKCPACDVHCKTISATVHHYQATHSCALPPLQFSCEQCHSIFTTPKARAAHVRAAHEGPTPHFKCTICHKILKTTTYKAHLQRHEETRTTYRCAFCTRTFLVSASLQSHIMARHTGEKPYVCATCGKSFAFSQTLSAHSEKHKESAVECAICGKKVIGHTKLRYHMRTHQPKPKPSSRKTGRKVDADVNHLWAAYYQCPDDTLFHCQDQHCDEGEQGPCQFKSENPRALFRHLRIHEAKGQDYVCDLCERSFKCKTRLVAHGRRLHDSRPASLLNYVPYRRTKKAPPTYTCQWCPKTFRLRANMTDHTRRLHTNQRPFKCEFCAKCFVTKNEMAGHAIRHFAGANTFKCTACKSAFTSVLGLSTHFGQAHAHSNNTAHEASNSNQPANKLALILHRLTPTEIAGFQNRRSEMNTPSVLTRVEVGGTTVRFFRCPEIGCGYKAGFQTLIVKHQRSHTGEKPHACTKCASAFSQSSNLTRHMASVHKESKDRFACQHCDKVFLLKGGLQAHLRSHSDERPFPCSYCDKRFKTTSKMRRHENLHTGHKPCRCKCMQGFSNKTELERHLRKKKH